MCGIVVVLHPNEQTVRRALEQMANAQAHRGPDGDGAVVTRLPDGRFLGLGHQLLAVRGSPDEMRQPVTWPDLVVTYNGELYNEHEMRSRLHPHIGSTIPTGDTAVVCTALAQHGPNALAGLEGMFAMAWFDVAKQLLHVARDRSGIKPVLWASGADWFVAASELRGVLASGLVPPIVDRSGLATLLAYGAAAAPLTPIAGVQQLLPGHHLQLDLRSTSRPLIRQWSDTPTRVPQTSVNRESLIDELEVLLDDAVRRHLESVRDVTVLLSAGIDSGLIAHFGRRYSPDLSAVTVGAHSWAMDETTASPWMADLLSHDKFHRVVRPDEAEIAALAESYFESVDQPGIDGFNTFLACDAARQANATVVLSGVGADELLGGYSAFGLVSKVARRRRQLGVLDKISRSVAPRASPLLRPLLGGGRAATAGAMLAAPLDAYKIALANRRVLSDRQLNALGFDRSTLGLDQNWLPIHSHSSTLEWQDAAAVAAVETSMYLPNTLLRDSDSYSMCHGLELRAPFLHARLVDWALRLPAQELLPAGRATKPLLREVARRQLGNEFANRAKTGFRVDLAPLMNGSSNAVADRIDALRRSGHVSATGVDQIDESLSRDRHGGESRRWLLASVGSWLDALG